MVECLPPSPCIARPLSIKNDGKMTFQVLIHNPLLHNRRADEISTHSCMLFIPRNSRRRDVICQFSVRSTHSAELVGNQFGQTRPSEYSGVHLHSLEEAVFADTRLIAVPSVSSAVAV